MKKLCICLLCLLLAGCGSGRAAAPAEVYAALLSGGGFDGEMTEPTQEMAELIFGISLQEAEWYAAVSASAAADELLVVRCEDAEAVEETLRERLARRTEDYAAYMPAEASKLQSAILQREGDVVIFCVCPDSEGAAKALG